jgi:DNA polymerase I-like protein with 3'-5' exonuclease and polymerase domains
MRSISPAFPMTGCAQFKTWIFGVSTGPCSQDEWDRAPLIGAILPCPDPTGAHGTSGSHGMSRDLIIDSLMREIKGPFKVAFFFLTRGYSFNKVIAGDFVHQAVSNAAITNCNPYLIADLDEVKPDRILLCGYEVGNTFIRGQFDVPTYRRKTGLKATIGKHTYPIQVTFMPYICATETPYIYCLREDCARLFGRFPTLIPGKKKLLTTLDEVLDYIDFLEAHEGFISVDTETANLNRKASNKLGTIQFATDPELGVVIPYQHYQSPFSADELTIIKKRLRDLFSKRIKSAGWIAHNAKFENTVFKNHFGTFINSAPIFDTQAMAFLLDETRSERAKRDSPKGQRGIYTLKALSRDLLGWDGYEKGALAAREEGTLIDLPLQELADYGCFKKGNWVVKRGGLISDISEIKIGDELLTHRNRFRKVTQVFAKPYKGKLLNLSFQRGHVIRGVTPNHPFLMQTESGQKWVRADELQPGSLCLLQKDESSIQPIQPLLKIFRAQVESILMNDLAQIKNPRANHKIVITKDCLDRVFESLNHPDFWWFFGLLLGDGSVRHVRRPSGHRVASCLVLSLHEKEISKTLEIVQSIFKSFHWSIVPRKGSLGVDLVLSNRGVATFFDVLMSTSGTFGKTASSKAIHPKLFQSLDSEKIKELLSGYFDADGHHKVTTKGDIQSIVLSVSSNLTNQIRLLLSKIDVRYTCRNHTQGVARGHRPVHVTTVFGKANYWWASRFGKAMRANLISTTSDPFVRVDYIEEYEEETTVYNCEVEEDNSYICNGIRVHNSMDAWVTFALFEKIQELAAAQGYLRQLMKLAEHYYGPVTRLIAMVEMTGFKTDLKYLRGLASRKGPIESKIDRLEAEMVKLPAFIEGNFRAVKKRNGGNTLGVMNRTPWILDMTKDENKKSVFFEVLGLSPVSFSDKTGLPSIDDEFFDAYREEYPEVECFAQWTEARKMRDTFITKILERIDPESGDPDCKMDQRIRANIWYSRLVTGRWAMTDPNMQQIPKAEEDVDEEMEELLVRKAVKDIFTVDDGCALLQIDYRVNEVRWAAILSGEPALARVFNEAYSLEKEARRTEDPVLLKKSDLYADVHKGTASNMFKVAIEAVTKTMRKISKAITFGILFQQSARALALSLGIPLEEAENHIAEFFSKFPILDNWIKMTKKHAADHGFVEAPQGRRRRFWGYELPSNYDGKRSQAARNDRQAVNSPIQGIASDAAMLGGACSLMDYIEEFKPHWLIQNVVHDSVLLQVPLGEVAETIQLMELIFVTRAQERMTRLGVNFQLPLAIDVEVGLRWGSLTKWAGTFTHANELQELVKRMAEAA